MAALTLANMLARVKRNVPTTTMDTELQDALLERMNYLASLDTFPFQEAYQSTTLSSGDYRLATPTNFAIIKSLTCWDATGDEREIELLDAASFSSMFPKPDENSSNPPSFACVRVAEGEIWFNTIADANYTIRIEFFAIPDDATDTTVSQLTELAKLTLVKWASADGFRMIGEHDRANQFENEGNGFFKAMTRRYQLALEEDARIISPKERHTLRKNSQ